MTSVLDEAASVDIVNPSAWPEADEEMYVAIVRAWCRLGSWEQRRRFPLGPYVLGREFVESVARAPVDRSAVAVVCARAASCFPSGVGGVEPEMVVGPPGVWPDSLMSWWRPLGRGEELGVFYGELAGDVLEFMLVGGRGEGPSGWGFARE